MFTTEGEALSYIDTNTTALLAELEPNEVKTVYTNDNTRINVMRNGKRILKFINRYEGTKSLVDIYKEMIDLKLL